jgi:hypothetical protein
MVGTEGGSGSWLRIAIAKHCEKIPLPIGSRFIGNANANANANANDNATLPDAVNS